MKYVSYAHDFPYADTRLRGTIFLTKKDKVPIYVKKVDIECGHVYCLNLLTHKDFVYPYEDVDMVPPKVGYVHQSLGLGVDTFFAERTPARYYKCGLNQRNVRGRIYNKNNTFGVDPSSSPFVKMLLGKYPKAVDSIERLVVGEAKMLPLSYNWATLVGDNVKNLKLLYRNHVVGDVKWNDHGDVNYQLAKDYDFLDTVMEKELYV